MRRAIVNLSDSMSIARVPLSLLFVGLYRRNQGGCLAASIVVAAIAQITDHLDGYVARRSGRVTVVGWLVDSVSDRSFYIAAILAFDREFGLNPFVVWAFVLREICLYAVRIVSGDFETVRPGFRRLVLAHAAIVRIGILVGCLIPFGLLPMSLTASATLNSLFAAAAGFGFSCLHLLVRALPREKI